MKMTFLTFAIAAGLALPALQSNAQDTTAPAAQSQRDMRPDFATLDSDGDGALTLEEVQNQAAARFADADTNGDGGLSVAELTAQADARRADRIGEMLAKRDTNEDGLLQADEMQSRGQDRLARMFDKLDADEDGTVTAEEFEAVGDRGQKGHGKRHGKRGGEDHNRKNRG